MNKKAIDALAIYFTGPDVALHSVGCIVGGHRGAAGKRFFAARDALGLKGILTHDHAANVITSTLKAEA